MEPNLDSKVNVSYSFGAKQAIGILIAFIIVMAVANSATAFLINGILESRLVNAPQDNEQIAGALIVLRQLASLIAASLLLFFYLKVNFRGGLKIKVLTDIGLVKTSRQWFVFAALFGFFFSFILSNVIAPSFPPKSDFVHNPLLSETQTGNWIQYLTALIAVCIAPATEELLFRGILYHGLSASWGKISAAVVTIALFILLHNETLAGGYWLSIFALIILSIFLLLAREFSGSIIPAVLTHSGFNLAILLSI
jgi:membrane protease YdiL (CAAX protease family)